MLLILQATDKDFMLQVQLPAEECASVFQEEEFEMSYGSNELSGSIDPQSGMQMHFSRTHGRSFYEISRTWIAEKGLAIFPAFSKLGPVCLLLVLAVHSSMASPRLAGKSASSANHLSAEDLSNWQRLGCLKGTNVYPLCRNPDNTLVFGGNDLLDTIRQANVAGLTSNYTYVVPTANYSVGTTLYLSGFSNIVIDFAGSVLVPSRPSLKPFDVGGIGIKNVTLTNFRLGSSNHFGFASALNILGYSSSPVNGLTFSNCEIAYTAEAAIKLVNVKGAAGTSSGSLQNIKVDHCYIHDTGGEGIKISGAKGVYLTKNVITNISQVGPLDPGTSDGTVEPVNISVSADTGEIVDNDLSGTPAWNRVPFGTATPASAIYFGGQNFVIAHNHIHNSECTYSLCAPTGTGAPLITTVLPNGGTAANYVSLGDGIHLDLAQKVMLVENDISEYSNGIVVEISRDIIVYKNTVDKFYSVGLWDNSRLDPGVVNSLQSPAQLTPASRVRLATDTQTTSCAGGCVAVNIPAHASGNLFCQTAAAAFSADNIIPSFQVINSSIDARAGSLSLVLYTTANCTKDPAAVSLPLPKLVANQPRLNYRLPVSSMQDIAFLTTSVSGAFQGGFGSWGIVASGEMPEASTLTLGGFGFELFSDSNRYAGNSISNGGVGLSVHGCGAGPTVSENSFVNSGSYTNGQDSYYGYFSSIAVFSGTFETCQRSGTTISHNQIRMDRTLSTSGNSYYAPIAIDSALSGGAAQIIAPVITNNTFQGPQGSFLLTSHSSVTAASTGLHASGNLGITP